MFTYHLGLENLESVFFLKKNAHWMFVTLNWNTLNEDNLTV